MNKRLRVVINTYLPVLEILSVLIGAFAPSPKFYLEILLVLS